MNQARSSALLNVGAIALALSLLALGPGSMARGAPGGIGVEVTIQDGWLTIVRVLDDTPAQRAGLQAGDRIAKINGESVHGVLLSQVLPRLAGQVGDEVALTIQRQTGEKTDEFDVTLTRQSIWSGTAPRQVSGDASRAVQVPTKEAQPVQWNGNKIVSRVLPYPDFVSLFIRLPIAHAAATGRGVKVAVVQHSTKDRVSSMIEQMAPGAEIHNYAAEPQHANMEELARKLKEAGCRVAVIPDVDARPEQAITQLAKALLSGKLVVIVPSDLSEEPETIATVNTLASLGALTVGRVDRQSMVMDRSADGAKAFNEHIRKIKTDVFSTVGLGARADPTGPTAAAAGVAALVLEKWPSLTGAEVRNKIIESARAVWQGTSVESGQWRPSIVVDPVTTQYTPTDEKAVFRFRVLDAAAALDVDTEIPWFLNMLNCHRAWEITKGKGATVVVSDQGFHIRHPDLVGSIKATKHFGPRTFDTAGQNFHGTDMSRILLAVAPEAKIIPVLCSAKSMELLAPNIAKSFEFAAEQKADVVTASWSAQFNKNEELLAAVRGASDSGVVVSWFHFPQAHPGVLRSSFTYAWWSREPCLGFADRLLTDPPGFHPVEIEAGLSGTAPQAAGIAALVKSVNPTLTPKQVEEIIFENSDTIGQAVLIPDVYRIVRAARDKAQR